LASFGGFESGQKVVFDGVGVEPVVDLGEDAAEFAGPFPG